MFILTIKYINILDNQTIIQWFKTLYLNDKEKKIKISLLMSGLL